MIRRDITYIINSHTKKGGCKQKYFVEEVQTEEERSNKNLFKSHTQHGGCKNISFVEKVNSEEEPQYKLYN